MGLDYLKKFVNCQELSVSAVADVSTAVAHEALTLKAGVATYVQVSTDPSGVTAEVGTSTTLMFAGETKNIRCTVGDKIGVIAAGGDSGSFVVEERI